MSNIIVLGGGYSQEIFLDALNSRFGPFCLIDINPDAPGRKWASQFYNVSIYDFDKCASAIGGIVGHDTSIITFATGHAGSVCSRLCSHFGLPSRSGDLMRAAIDKEFLSRRLRKHGMPSPRGFLLEEVTEKPMGLDLLTYPAILKPISDGGGRNVQPVASIEEALGCFKSTGSSARMMLQEKLDGLEQVVFVIVKDGVIAALLHGVNIFDDSTGWNGPVGIALERLPIRGTVAGWVGNLAKKLVEVFDLHNDFVAVELISTSTADYIIDVEINALTPFACSKVMDGGQLVDMLLSTYLGTGEDEECEDAWVSAMAFLISKDKEALCSLSESAAVSALSHGAYVEPTRAVTELHSFSTSAYKGGYVIVSDATDLTDAAVKVSEATRRIWRGK